MHRVGSARGDGGAEPHRDRLLIPPRRRQRLPEGHMRARHLLSGVRPAPGDVRFAVKGNGVTVCTFQGCQASNILVLQERIL